MAGVHCTAVVLGDSDAGDARVECETCGFRSLAPPVPIELSGFVAWCEAAAKAHDQLAALREAASA